MFNPFETKKKSMLPMRKAQADALEKFENHYYNENNDLGILSACCGFGKTRLCYEIIKKCHLDYKENIFIIVTSRVKLINDTMKDMQEWFNIENIKVKLYLVGETDTKYKDQKLSNEDEIQNAIERHAVKNKNLTVIITTYNSSVKVKNALQRFFNFLDTFLKF
jgi:predicted helicase